MFAASLRRGASLAGVALTVSATGVGASSNCDGALSKKEFTALKVKRNVKLSPNVHKVTVALPTPTDTLGMTVAGMLMLVVKDYDEGNVSSHICSRNPGDELKVKGCFTKIKVEANKWKRVGMVAGGSGLTPCLQVVEELLSLEDDMTQINLLFCNRNEDEIFLREHLDGLAERSCGRFHVHYCVDAPISPSWSGLTGYATDAMLATWLPPPGEGTMIMVCGPPPMYTAVSGPKLFEKGKPPKQGELSGILKDLGFTADMVFKF
ncbi:cytochrome-b5 reductase [Aureococcus anophagefferens]|nr:cytochrome-b5 reductase [Aureococcus anophagefferens]